MIDKMTLSRTQVREEILSKPCEKCGKKIPKNYDCVLSFYRGNFVVFHIKCWEETVKGKGVMPDDADCGRISPGDIYNPCLNGSR